MWQLGVGLKQGCTASFKESKFQIFKNVCLLAFLFFFYSESLESNSKHMLRSPSLLLSPILAWAKLSQIARYYFLRSVFFRASVEIVPSAEHFVNPNNPIMKYLDFLLPILKPSLGQIRLWVSHLLLQQRHSPTLQKSIPEPLYLMGRKDRDADILGTTYPNYMED
jgi:hypothetical protein